MAAVSEKSALSLWGDAGRRLAEQNLAFLVRKAAPLAL
jgi:hypothetical protein